MSGGAPVRKRPPLRAVVLVDHGSREPDANAQLERMARALRRRLAGVPVEIAHLSLVPPDIEDAVAACAARGVREVVVLPYFLGPGRHATQDVPRLARAAAKRHGLRVRVAEPLGLHPGLVDALVTRVRRAPAVSASRRGAARGGSS